MLQDTIFSSQGSYRLIFVSIMNIIPSLEPQKMPQNVCFVQPTNFLKSKKSSFASTTPFSTHHERHLENFFWRRENTSPLWLSLRGRTRYRPKWLFRWIRQSSSISCFKWSRKNLPHAQRTQQCKTSILVTTVRACFVKTTALPTFSSLWQC